MGVPAVDDELLIAFAGPNKKTLYIVGRGAAYKVQLLAQGFSGRAK